MSAGRWEPNDDPCPRCGTTCENRVELDADGHEILTAERCPTCRWVIDFEVSDDYTVESYR